MVLAASWVSMYDSDISDKEILGLAYSSGVLLLLLVIYPMINRSKDSKIPKSIEVIEFVADLRSQGPKSRNICSLLPMLVGPFP